MLTCFTVILLVIAMLLFFCFLLGLSCACAVRTVKPEASRRRRTGRQHRCCRLGLSISSRFGLRTGCVQTDRVQTNRVQTD